MKDVYIGLAAMGMATGAMLLKAKDANTTGADDAMGNILEKMAPALTVYLAGDTKKLVGALRLSRDALDAAIEQLETENT